MLKSVRVAGGNQATSRIHFSNDPFILTLQIFGYNLIPSFLIIGANLIAQQSRSARKKFIPINSTVFFGLAVFFGVIAGTWSFDTVSAPPPLGSRVFRLFDIVPVSLAPGTYWHWAVSLDTIGAIM